MRLWAPTRSGGRGSGPVAGDLQDRERRNVVPPGPPLLLEDGPVALLDSQPVEAVAVEGGVTGVVDVGLMGDHQAPARASDAGAQVVVLEAADVERLVEE